MTKLLKLAAVAVALTMFVSAAAEAQGGGGGGGGGQGRGRGGPSGQIVAEGVSADSAYNILFTGITLDATKKAAVVKLITQLQVDLRANPQPRGGRGGGAAGGGTPPDSATMAANAAITAKRNAFITTFQTEAKKQLTPEQITVFDATYPAPGARRGGGGGGL